MKKRERVRIDKLLFEQGLTKSRELARSLILEGKVLVDNKLVDKAGTLVNRESEISVKDNKLPYVSRGGVKLKRALKIFKIKAEGKTVLDVGSSTGGFTDCMLQHGAKQVFAIDVGYGQLDWKLRNDKRVVVLEKRNIRYLERDEISAEIDIAVIDVSFISLKKVLPKVAEFLKTDGEGIALLKPQFEVGRYEVGKGGIVRETAKHRNTLLETADFIIKMNASVKGIIPSPILGKTGNKEFFIYFSKPKNISPHTDLKSLVDNATK